MPFKPTDDFTEAWTSRLVLATKPKLLAYNLGNNASEPLVRSNYKYHVANPSISLTGRARNRNAGTGALADVAALTSDSASLSWIEVVATGNQNWPALLDDRDLNYAGPVTLGWTRSQMQDAMRAWVDGHIWDQVQSLQWRAGQLPGRTC